MKTYLKSSLLFLAVLSASTFMIIESGAYYQKFYQNSFQGYWAACLVESFLAIAAMLHFKDKKGLNAVIKLTMIPLFLVVVGGASLKVITPMVDELAQVETKNKLVVLLEMENQQSIVNLDRLKGQKVNTAIEIRRQREATNQLKETLKGSTTFDWMIWIVIGFSTFLRFSVQVSNLVFAHSLGVIWREKKIGKKKSVKKKTDKPKSKTEAKKKQTRQKRSSAIKAPRSQKKEESQHNIIPVPDILPTEISESQMF